ncbi:MAG: efflux RND transporter periplasmic adaptor subunit [Burkholderiales bacterium]|jgi:RND family efflux transporter MFP subunit
MSGLGSRSARRAAALALVAATSWSSALAQQGPGTEPAAASAPIRVLLIPARETTVVSQMVGRVDRLGGDLGAPVKAGAPLVVFDCGELKAREGIADAELDAARQQLDTKTQLKSLNAAGDTEVQLAATAVNRARAQLDLAKHQAAQCRIDAPFAGRIVKLHVKPFQSVSVGQPLVEMVAAGPLKLRLNAPSRWLAWIKPGTTFRIQVDETGRAYPATVTAINGRVDAASQSVEVEGAVKGAFPELLAGMSGTAVFQAPR